jgi:hypothetical protein
MRLYIAVVDSHRIKGRSVKLAIRIAFMDEFPG